MDVEVLIAEVEKRPGIWDTSSEEYKDKNKKTEAWVEVCCILFANYTSKSEIEKKIIVQDTISKWRSVRDNYIRSLKKQSDCNKSGSGAKRIARYIFEGQLSFKKKGTEMRPSSSSIPFSQNNVVENTCNIPLEDDSNADGDTTGNTPDSPTDNSPARVTYPKPQPTKKAKKSNIEERLIAFMESSQQRHRSQDEDEDTAFFNSLLPSVRSLDMDTKIQFRIQVMRVLQNLKTSARGASHQIHHPAAHYQNMQTAQQPLHINVIRAKESCRLSSASSYFSQLSPSDGSQISPPADSEFLE